MQKSGTILYQDKYQKSWPRFILKFFGCILVGILLYLATALSIWKFWYKYSGHPLDSLFFAIVWPFDQTEYASQYSDQKLSLVKIGTPLSEVKRLLGEPIQIWQKDGARFLEYSCYRSSVDWCSPVDGFFHQRRISINMDGKVMSVDREYWID